MNFAANKVTFYAILYQNLRLTAYKEGYALTLHGSLQKDLDVVAIPWTEECSNHEILAKALCDSANGFISNGSRLINGVYEKVEEPQKKPHGRLCYIIHLGSNGGYIDLSIMPKYV